MIFDKPFIKQEMLRRTIFKGRPNFFNAKDLNKELLIIHSYMEDFNNRMAIISNVKFTIANFSETFDNMTGKWTRIVNITWTSGRILYKGVEFQIPAGGMPIDFEQIYDNPDTTVSPKEVKPPSYLCLTAELNTVTYADNPILGGIQSDEVPNSVPTVDVEQYSNPTFFMTDEPDAESGVIAIIAVIHPRHKEDGSADGFGFLQYTMENPDFRLKNGNGNQDGNFKGNKTLFEYLIERISGRLDFLLNERQLIRRFNLADILDFAKARFNIGFSNIVNHRQLVQEENLKDILDKTKARFNLGLGSGSTRDVGNLPSNIAPGNIVPVGAVVMWLGSVASIPDGWVLCDGTNGTKDMRKLFPVGASSTDPEYAVGNTGGLAKVKLTSDETALKAHGHDINDPGHEHPIGLNLEKVGNGNQNALSKTPGGGATLTKKSTTGITVKSTVGADAEEAHENRPPFIGVNFIMYKGIETITGAVPVQADLQYPNYSTPSNATDNGYATYTPVSVGGSGGTSMGSGVILTNPE